MLKAYGVYALLICLLLAYANARGWVMGATLFTQNKWGTQGPAFHHK
ncbi:MAG TPA: hypothetical protein VFV50_13140 [Bdellovibrionales bacterium]|nr:hypothetical protein [Bdellovibrionales bacterium]